MTYEIVVENTGGADLTDVSVLEDLAAEFGPAFVSAGNAAISTPPADPTSIIVLNSAFDGSSDSELIDNSAGTILQIGDSFTLQFDVIVNPMSSVLDNQVVASGNAVDENGIPLTDISGNPLTASDDSDSGSDPDGTNAGAAGDTGGSDDPTPLFLPSVGLAKSVGTPVPNGDNFDVTYTLVFENTGNVSLDNVQVLDDVAAQFGSQFVGIVPGSVAVQNFNGTGTAPTANAGFESSTAMSLVTSAGAVDPGDTFEVVYTVTIDPSQAPAGSIGLDNQASTSGEALDSNGNPVLDDMGNPVTTNDLSDSGTDPTNGGGAGTNEDPTSIVLPNIGVAKEVFSTPVALPNGDFEVTYQLVVENTGNVDLAGLSLTDDLATQFGPAFVSVSAGSLTVVTQPTDPASSVVINASFDGNVATEIIDQAATTFLAVGDSYTVQFTVVVDPDATGTSGPLNNQAMVTGNAVDASGNPLTDPSGNPVVVTDDSDNGANPVGDNGVGTSDDPTPLLLPDLSVAKQANTVVPATDASGNELTGAFDVTYLVVIENTGTIELTDLQITDDITLLSNFGDAYDPTFIGANSSARSGLIALPTVASNTLANQGDLPIFDGAFLGGDGRTGIFDGASGALQVGEQIVVEYTVRIDAAELTNGPDAPTPGNQVQGSANSAGGMVNDNSDGGLDPNSDNGAGTTDDPTPFEVPQIRLFKAHSDAVENPDGSSTITVSLRVQNSGTVPVSNLSLTCLLYTSPSPRDRTRSRMPSSA